MASTPTQVEEHPLGTWWRIELILETLGRNLAVAGFMYAAEHRIDRWLAERGLEFEESTDLTPATVRRAHVHG